MMNPLCDILTDAALWLPEAMKGESTRLHELHPQVTVLKAARWAFDSIILSEAVQLCAGEQAPALKIHVEMFPIASHIYRNVALLDALSASGVCTRVDWTDIIEVQETDYRVVAFDFIRGSVSLQQMTELSDDDNVAAWEAVDRLVTSLLGLGVHPLVRDLSDFQLVRGRDLGWTCIMTDHNAMLDCSMSSSTALTAAGRVICSILRREVASASTYAGSLGGLEAR